MIDKNLNYGRHLVLKNLEQSIPFQVVLDLGAGHGDDLKTAKKLNPDAKLYAIESYPPYIRELESQGVKVFAINIEKNIFPFEDESVDIIICNQILEHCKELFWILHEISRVLKKGGKLIIGVPNLASLHNRILLLIGEQPTSIKNNSAHLRGYTKKDVIMLMNSGFPEGYRLLNFGGSNYYPFNPFIAKILANFFPTSSWGIFFLFEKINTYDRSFLEFPIQKQLETNFYLGNNKS